MLETNTQTNNVIPGILSTQTLCALVQKARSKHPVKHIHTNMTHNVLSYVNESITVQYISFFLLFISSPENNIDFGKNELKTEKKQQ